MHAWLVASCVCLTASNPTLRLCLGVGGGVGGDGSGEQGRHFAAAKRAAGAAQTCKSPPFQSIMLNTAAMRRRAAGERAYERESVVAPRSKPAERSELLGG